MPFDNYIYLLYNSDDKRTFNEKLALYNNFPNTDKANYGNNVSLIVEKILPAAYIPFLHNNSEKNSGIFMKEYDTNNDAKFVNNLNYSINNLDIDRKCYNSFKIDNLIYMCIFLWIIILSLILNVVYYYYKNIYTYILIIATIILLGIAVVFKMISTINQ